MALREVLAELKMKVEGLGDVEAANTSVDAYLASVSRAPTELEALRLKQLQAADSARYLASAISKLQREGGDNAEQLAALRLEYVRAQGRAGDYGRQIAELGREQGSSQAKTAELTERLMPLARAFGVSEERVQGFAARLTEAAPRLAAMAAITAIGVGVVAVLRRIGDELVEVADRAKEIQTASARFGVSGRALQEWEYIARRSGVTSEALGQAFRTVARNAAGPAAAQFARLGVATRDANGQLRPTSGILEDTLVALRGLPSQTDRAARAQALFGEAGTQLLTIVDQGPDGIRRLRERFAELGGGLEDGVVESGADAANALTDFDTASESLRSALATSVLPVFTWLVEHVATAVGEFTELARTTSIVQTAVGFLGVALAAFAAAAAYVFSPVLVIGAVLGLLFLAVEDVVTAFRGGDSVFGRTVEWLLSLVGVTMTFSGAVESVGVAWRAVESISLEAIANIVEAAEGLQTALGLGDLDAAASRTAEWRQRANDSMRATEDADTLALLRESERQARRARAELPADAGPAPAVVERRGASSAGASRQAGGGTVDMRTTFHIQGGDPEATAREVDRLHRRRLAEARATLPLAPEASGG